MTGVTQELSLVFDRQLYCARIEFKPAYFFSENRQEFALAWLYIVVKAT